MFAAKGRPADHPVIVHLADARVDGEVCRRYFAGGQAACGCVLARTDDARRASWPADQQPGDRWTRYGRPARAESSGGPGAFARVWRPHCGAFGESLWPRELHHGQSMSQRSWASDVDLILDGGECTVGLESTIIDVSGPQPAILRPGAVTAEQVSSVLGFEVAQLSSGGPRVSGSLPSHYAPRAPLKSSVRISLLRERSSLPVTEKKSPCLLASQFHSNTQASWCCPFQPKSASSLMSFIHFCGGSMSLAAMSPW